MPFCNEKETRKKKAAALMLLFYIRKHDTQKTEAEHLHLQFRGKQRRRRKPRSCWMRMWLSDQRRQQYGHFTTLLNELKTEDQKAFFNYTRLPRGLFYEVLQRIEGRIKKKDTRYRKSLSPGLKLSITLRHLACGDSYPSLSYNFRVAPNTFSLIITEVCEAIKAEFATEVIQCPTTSEEWTTIAEQFEKRWQFPHCCGALDGKHVALSCPWNTGSQYRNSKGFFSVGLMALVDADYKFLWVDVGADGSSNDASIYNMSELKEGLESDDNMFNLTAERSLPGDDVPVPYFIARENAFGISKRLVNPFSIRNMEFHERIFNYRLSRARRVVENAFGILAQKFRVLLRTMNQRPENVRRIITSCVILHNLIRLRYPQVHSNLLDLEDQNKHLMLAPGEARRYSLMCIMSEIGTLGHRG